MFSCSEKAGFQMVLWDPYFWWGCVLCGSARSSSRQGEAAEYRAAGGGARTGLNSKTSSLLSLTFVCVCSEVIQPEPLLFSSR